MTHYWWFILFHHSLLQMKNYIRLRNKKIFSVDSKITKLKIESNKLSFLFISRSDQSTRKYFWKIIWERGHRENGFSAVFETIPSNWIDGTFGTTITGMGKVIPDADELMSYGAVKNSSVLKHGVLAFVLAYIVHIKWSISKNTVIWTIWYGPYYTIPCCMNHMIWYGSNRYRCKQ